MDRTIIVPYRAEEKELSILLYKAIQSLTLVHPPTEDLRKCLSEEMFIKPNQQAFFHVMHYLFRILDAQEFKKRFFWPITDKRSEANFRTSTVEYLKFINEKHQLNWTNIKSYLVVMPGGMKFISFLLDFVNFIVKELIKQKEKHLDLDANQCRQQVSESSLHKICAKNALFKAMASEYLDTIESLNAKYEEKIQKILQQLEALSLKTGVSVNMLTDDKFLQDFEANNKKLFEQRYSKRTEKILQMDNIIKELKEAMDAFYSKETEYKYDKQRLRVQLKRVRDHFSIGDFKEGNIVKLLQRILTESFYKLISESFGSKVTDESVNINTLISTFNAINATIQNELKMLNERPCAGEFVYSRLINIKNDLVEIEAHITEFQKVLNADIKKSKTDYPQTPVRASLCRPTNRNFENNLFMKLVSTPPIRIEVPEGMAKPRLALVDSKTTTDITFKNFLGKKILRYMCAFKVVFICLFLLAPPRAATIRQINRHNSIADQSNCDLNTTLNRSKIIDPMQLLRSTSKKDTSKYKIATPKANISNLSSNWKLRQSLLLNDNDDHKPLTSNNENITTSPQSQRKTPSPSLLQQSPLTPFGSNDRTRIAKSQFHLSSGKSVGNNQNHTGTLTSIHYIKKLSAVRMVQDASVNLTNLSTSPSGRLEPLVTVEDFTLPKLKLNDLSLNEYNVSMKVNQLVRFTDILCIFSEICCF